MMLILERASGEDANSAMVEEGTASVPRFLVPRRSMDTIICWRFPRANEAKRRRSQCVSSLAWAKRH